jgi:hypothetical protein
MAAKLRYGVIGTGMMGVEHLKTSRRFARLVTGPGPRNTTTRARSSTTRASRPS